MELLNLDTTNGVIKIKGKVNSYVYLEKNNKKTIKQIEKDTGKDYYMSSKEAKEYGIIDDIIKK